MNSLNLFKKIKSPRVFYFVLFLLSNIRCEAEEVVTSIAFGSCLKETRPQPIWESVIDSKPDVFVLLGDNIYGDTRDMDKLRERWKRFGAIEGFQKLRSNSRLLAIWDDHDYGENDAGAEFPAKFESQKVFLDFLNEPEDSRRRKSPGIYDCLTLGPEGKRVQFILLDTRFFRTSLKKETIRITGKGPYGPNYSDKAEILGKEQWSWLEQKLNEPAEIRIIASSIQVLSITHGWETWGNFPKERQRLLNLLSKVKGRVIIISGDRHSAEISKLKDEFPYPLLDITSSAMNQRQRPNVEENSYRIGERYFNENFGFLQIGWEQNEITITASIRDLDGKMRIAHKVNYSMSVKQ